MRDKTTERELDQLANAVLDFTAAENRKKAAVCADCEHLRDIDVNSNGVWYSLKCAAPATQAEKSTNPQTGEVAYLKYNDLGGAYYDDDPRPYCRNINSEGSCHHFSAVASRQCDQLPD